MYNFIFYVLYKANIKDGRFTAKYQASLIVFLAILIHALLFFSILKRIFIKQFEASNISEWFNEHKAVYILIMIIFIFILYRYYNDKKIEKILNKYSNKPNSTKASNIIKVLLILLVPIILGGIILTIKL